MNDVDAYVTHMNRLLDSACTLFPNGQSPTAAPAGEAPPAASAPDGASELARGAEAGGEQYRRAGARITALEEAIRQAVDDAVAEGRRGAEAAAAIRDGARSEAGALAPSTQAPEGLGHLVTALDDRLAAMQTEISSTRLAMHGAAERIRAHSAELAAVLADTSS